MNSVRHFRRVIAPLPRTGLLVWLALLIGSVVSNVALALPFTLYLSGAMERPTFNAAAAGLEKGDRFDLALTLDPGAVTDSYSSPFSSQPDTMAYFGGIAALTGTLAGVDLALGAPLPPGAFNPAEVVYRRGDSAFPNKHIVQFAPSLDTVFGDALLTRLFIGFVDNDGGFLDSTAFTADPLRPGFLDDLEDATVQFQFSSTGGFLENPLGRPDYAGLAPRASVPAPGTAWLFLIAVLSHAAAWCWRRKWVAG